MAMRLSEVPRLAQAGGLELAARRIVEGLYGGRHRSPFTGSATDFHDHRPYHPGDDLRAIDWKAYARSDRLLVRRYREERDLPLTLVLDRSASMAYGAPDKWSWAALAAATLGLLAIEQGDRVRLLHGAGTLDGRTPERGGPAAASALCAALEALHPEGDGLCDGLLASCAEQLERRTLVVVFSDLLLEPTTLRPVLAALSARGHDLAVIQVLDRSELALPAEWGPSRFSDPEGRVAELAADAATVKASYDAAMAAHLATCRRCLAACRADHVLAGSDQEVGDVLGRWLHRRRCG